MSEIVKNDIKEILSHDLPWESLDGSTILITGATGMVGSYVVNTLLSLPEERHVNVLALVRDKGKAERLFGAAAVGRLTIMEQDVAEPIDTDSPLDIIIHAASPASPDKFKSDPVGVIRANVLGSFSALELARRTGARYCFISTMEAYGQMGEGSDDVYVSEDGYGRLDSLDLRSAYPESKRVAENLAVAYGHQYGVDYRVARMTHTYGPGMDINDTRVQAEFIRHALNGEDIVLKTDGSLRRTYTYISDAISGIFYIILTNSGDRVYNIANEDAELSIKDLAQAVIDASDSGPRLVMDVQDNKGSMWSKSRNIFADCTRLRSLGWKASVGPAEGVSRTMQFHKEKKTP